MDEVLALPAEARAEMGRAGREFVLGNCDLRSETRKLSELIEARRQRGRGVSFSEGTGMRAQGLVQPIRLARTDAFAHCPICERSFPRFKRVTDSPLGLECPRCGSRPRHRLLWMFLINEELFARPGVRILHVASEGFLAARLRTRLAHLVTADLEDPKADVRADITDLPFGDREFDLVICSQCLSASRRPERDGRAAPRARSRRAASCSRQ